jgi:hypothetical protein
VRPFQNANVLGVDNAKNRGQNSQPANPHQSELHDVDGRKQLLALIVHREDAVIAERFDIILNRLNAATGNFDRQIAVSPRPIALLAVVDNFAVVTADQNPVAVAIGRVCLADNSGMIKV